MARAISRGRSGGRRKREHFPESLPVDTVGLIIEYRTRIFFTASVRLWKIVQSPCWSTQRGSGKISEDFIKYNYRYEAESSKRKQPAQFFELWLLLDTPQYIVKYVWPPYVFLGMLSLKGRGALYQAVFRVQKMHLYPGYLSTFLL